jgi:hypothetical protein
VRIADGEGSEPALSAAHRHFEITAIDEISHGDFDLSSDEPAGEWARVGVDDELVARLALLPQHVQHDTAKAVAAHLRSRAIRIPYGHARRRAS